MENGSNGEITEAEWIARFGISDGVWDDDARLEDNGQIYGLEFASDIDLDTASNDIIADLIGPGDFAVVYGPSGSGKTFFAIELGYCLALGLPIAGKDIRTAAVLYVGYEGARGIKKRFVAARRKFRDPGCQFARLTLPAPLGSSNGTVGLKAIIDAVARLKVASRSENVVVIIDTLSRAIAGDDENSSKDMSAFIERRAGEITRRTGAAVVCVHHTGKDESRGMRGSSALFAACDAVVSVIDQRVKIEKSKDGEAGQWFAFELEQVVLGEDNHGKSITTCVVVERDALAVNRSSKSKRSKLTDQDSRCKDYLAGLYDQKKHLSVTGAEIGSSDAGDRWLVVKLSDLKDACRKGKLTLAPSDDTPAKEADREYQAFKRAVGSLDTKHNLIGRYGDYVWDLEISRNRGRNDRST